MAATASGLSAHAIRAWEKRYQALTPMRSETGKRLYSEKEIERLCLLAHLVNLGSSIGQIARLPDGELQEIYQKLSDPKNFLRDFQNIKKVVDENTLEKLFESVERYDVSEISRLLTQVCDAISPGEFAQKIILPIYQKIKSKDNIDFSHAQGRIIKSLLTFYAGELISRHFEKDFKTPLKITLTNLDYHEASIDLLLAALICCDHRQCFYFYNTSLPETEIGELVAATASNVLILNLAPDFSMANLLHIKQSLPSYTDIWIMGDSVEQMQIDFPVKKIVTLDHLHQLIKADA